MCARSQKKKGFANIELSNFALLSKGLHQPVWSRLGGHFGNPGFSKKTSGFFETLRILRVRRYKVYNINNHLFV